MSKVNNRLSNCIIYTDYPEDLKSLFQERADINELNSLVETGIRIEKIEGNIDLQNYGLLIEDEISNISGFIRRFSDITEIENWLICKKLSVAQEFLLKVDNPPRLVCLDFLLDTLPVKETHKYYELLKNKWSNIPVLGITQYEQSGDSEHIGLKNKMRSNGDSVYNKGEIMSALANIIRDKLAINTLKSQLNFIKSENERLVEQINIINKELPQDSGFPYLIGKSLAMRKIYRDLDMLSNVDNLRVLILGEPGTGKELIARAVYEKSPRGRDRIKPYASFNCGTLSDDVNSIKSDIFGHVKGAFNDARTDRDGLLKNTNNGTLFFDEIGNLPNEVQKLLLRFLEQNEYYPFGSDIIKKADIRFIFATNANLDELVKKGQFRDDFIDRIKQHVINVPALRDRKEDISALVDYFINNKVSIKKIFGNDKVFFEIEDGALDILKNFSYPGNVRQLKALIENAMLKAFYNSIYKENKILITRQYVIEGAASLGIDFTSSNNSVMAVSTIEDDGLKEAYDFLDKVENLINREFETYSSVSQELFLTKFASTKTGKLSITRQSFTNDELNPRKEYLKKLLSNYSDEWSNTRKKCQFIRSLSK